MTVYALYNPLPVFKADEINPRANIGKDFLNRYRLVWRRVPIAFSPLPAPEERAG